MANRSERGVRSVLTNSFRRYVFRALGLSHVLEHDLPQQAVVVQLSNVTSATS
jgi:hypothetical protein